MKNGGQREVGGRCKSPKDCLLYEMPLFYPTNRLYKFSDRRGKTLDSMRNDEFKEWDLDSEMIEKVNKKLGNITNAVKYDSE